MLGFLYSIIAGISMSLQGVFNTRVSEKMGTWQTNVFVQGTALIFALVILFLSKGGNFSNIKSINKIYLSGGLLAVLITYTVMKGIGSIGVTPSISTILIAQLVSAALIDCCGLFDTVYTKFSATKVIGTVVMIIGVFIFKYKA